MKTMQDVKAANAAAGHHWFEKSTMEFFNSRIESGLRNGRFFVTSERCPWADNTPEPYPRLYSIREAAANGTIDTYGEFQGYETLEAAIEGIPA